jgi:hypothetical protein
MTGQSNHVDARDVNAQLGQVLAEVFYLREKLLSARGACVIHKTRGCVKQLLYAAASLDRVRLKLADTMDMFTDGVTEPEADEALDNELRAVLRKMGEVA